MSSTVQAYMTGQYPNSSSLHEQQLSWRIELGEIKVGGCIQKFPDWQPGARTANGTALCH
jgi:hypothetical protein